MFRHMDVLGIQAPSQVYVAVDLFFLLSGAVIAHAYEGKLLDDLSVGSFFARRLVRLYPMVVVGVAAGILNVVFGAVPTDTRSHLWLVAVLSLVIFPGNPLLERWNFNAPGWSLSYELGANIVYAAFIRHLTNRRLVMICAGSALILVVAALRKGHIDTGYEIKQIPLGLGRVGFSFFAGVLLYRLHRQGRLTLPSVLRGHVGLVAMLALTAAGLFIEPPRWALGAHALVSICLVFPAVLILGLETRWAPAGISDFLGEISYPIYLIHAPLASLAAATLARQEISGHVLLVSTVFAATMVALAWALARFYDAPIRAALTAALRRRRVALAPA